MAVGYTPEFEASIGEAKFMEVMKPRNMGEVMELIARCKNA